MKATCDEQATTHYVRFSDAARPGLIVDYDAAGRIAAFEMLDAEAQLARGALAGVAVE